MKKRQCILSSNAKKLEDQDAMRDSQRKKWRGSLGGMLYILLLLFVASLADLDQAQKTLGDMRPTYFVAVAGIVAAFFGCFIQRNDSNDPTIHRTSPTSVWVERQVVTKVIFAQEERHKVVQDVYQTTVYDSSGHKQSVTKSSTVDFLV